jgi:hypothetical protein
MAQINAAGTRQDWINVVYTESTDLACRTKGGFVRRRRMPRCVNRTDGGMTSCDSIIHHIDISTPLPPRRGALAVAAEVPLLLG